MRRHLAVLLATVPLAWAVPLRAQTDSAARVDPAKDAAIRALLRAAGTTDLILAGLEQALAQGSKDVSPGFLEEFQVAVRTRVGDFTDMLVPIYAAELSLDEIRQVGAFFETPAGRRFVAAQPTIMRESMKAGERWGMMVAGEVIADMAKKGKPIR